ncbi:MAG: DUF4861 family protein [Kiritimatiellae bacterium]|nr:DUF4861 family protein [Kiritimatiellia bacterium]
MGPLPERPHNCATCLYGRSHKAPRRASDTLNTQQLGHAVPYALGQDLMEVRKTFGAGGICLFENPDNPEELARPRFSPHSGSGPLTDTRYAFDLIANGPVRSTIRMRILNWRTGKGAYETEQDYTAYMNKPYYTCRVRYRTFEPGGPGVAFGCGIRRMINENASFRTNNAVITASDDLMAVITPMEGSPGLKQGVKPLLALGLVVRSRVQPVLHATDAFEGNYVFRIPANKEIVPEEKTTSR